MESRYVTRAFTITDVFADNEFHYEVYEKMFLLATLHICVHGEHVPIIERSITTTKDRARAASITLPY